MKTKYLITTALATALAAQAWAEPPKMKMTTDIPESVITPDKVETPIGTLEYFDGVPIGGTKDALYDYVDRARAVQVYIEMIPAVSTYSLLQGSKDMSMGEFQPDPDLGTTG